jgi:hypothetical protein
MVEGGAGAVGEAVDGAVGEAVDGAVGEAVVGAGAEGLGVWLCRGWGCCVEEATVSRRKMFYSLHWK